jgi:hypothetical protein
MSFQIQSKMEEKKRTLSSNALYYGLITGAAMILYGLVLFLLNQHLNRMLNWFSWAFLLGGMVWGTLEYRKTAGGFLTYGGAFKSVFMIGLFAAILSAIYTFIFVQFIHPGFINEIIDMSRQSLVEKYPDWSDEQVEQAMVWTTKFMNPIGMAIYSLLGQIFGSLVAGLLLGIFLRKEDKSLQTSGNL